MATKWNDEFVERRMAAHQRWRHEVEYAMLEEILDEVQNLPPRRPKTARLFLDVPEFFRERSGARV